MFEFHHIPQVFNSRKLRSDALIGGFHLDVGTVYEEDDHVFHNKWLLLTSPEDAAAGAMGYLQVSMSVIGTGDDAPVCQIVNKLLSWLDVDNIIIYVHGWKCDIWEGPSC